MNIGQPRPSRGGRQLTDQQISDLLNNWRNATSGFPPATEVGSAFAEDAELVHKYQPAHTAWGSLSIAVEHLHALDILINQARVLHAHAPFTLVRAAVENAATAAWVISPDESKQRIKRCLQWHHHNQDNAGLFFNELNGGAAERALAGKPPTNDLKKEIRGIALTAGLTKGDVGGRFTGYLSVVKESTRHLGWLTGDGVNPAVTSWQACSGFSHGQPWASLSLLTKEIVQTDDEAGVSNVRFSTDVNQVFLLAEPAFMLTDLAFELFEHRRKA